MTIKSRMNLIQEIWIPLLISSILALLFLLNECSTDGLLISILFMTVVICYLSLVYIAGSKTIVFDRTGVTVYLHNYLLRYRWDEIEMKQLISSQHGNNNQFRYGGIFFSTKKVHLPLIMNPLSYCLFRHPLKYFWISFESKTDQQQNSISSRFYEVDKQVILSLLQEWGISLSD